MTDPATPSPGTDGTFTYGRDSRGNLLLDGVIVERNQFADAYEVPDEVEEPAGKQNTAIEGEATTPAKEPEPVIEAPPPTSEPERLKFTLKVHGEQIERELTRDELTAKLQLAEDYTKKTQALAEEKKKIEPYLPIIEKPEFREWLETQVQLGTIDTPKPPPPPAPEDVMGYRMRTQEPDFQEIQSAMVEWAATLPQHEAGFINDNHRVFNEVFDRFKAARSAKAQSAPQTPSVPVQVEPKVIEKAIAAKEVAKETARVESPGGQQEEPDPHREWKRIDRELQKAVREKERFVNYRGKRMEADVAWVLHRTG